jgi:hypothetical protein
MKKLWIICLILAALLLTACQSGGDVAVSAEKAAIDASIRLWQTNAVIDSNSFQIRQKQKIEGVTFVMLSFDRFTEGRDEQCLGLFQAEFRLLAGGWFAGNGGGSCYGVAAGEEIPEGLPPVDIGAGTSSSSRPTDPGFSEVNGLVHQDDIRKIRVTWNDGMTQEVDVINDSYLSVRTGSFQHQKIEALDADGNVVYDSVSEVAPGKQ